MQKSDLLSILFAILAMGCIAVMDTTNKVVLATVPLLMVLWFRYAFQALVTTAFLLPKEGWGLFKTQKFSLQLIRGLLLFGCSFFGFKSLEHVPVAEFTAIGMLTPLLVTVLAQFFMKERVSLVRWGLILGGLAGAVLIVRPGGSVPFHAAIYPICMVVLYAFFQILTSFMARTESPLTMHFLTGWVGTAFASILVLGWWTSDITLLELSLMVLVGLGGTLGHYLLILAYARTSASNITPYLYSGIAFATLLGWVVFHHMPDFIAGLGITLIALCGIGSAWSNYKNG
jgi:drug/metabolite transporter (DMT)-like permease